MSLHEIARLKLAVPTLIGAKQPGGDEAWYGELPDISVLIPDRFMTCGYWQASAAPVPTSPASVP